MKENIFGQELYWKAAPDLKGIYELSDDETVVARFASVNEAKSVGAIDDSDKQTFFLFEIEDGIFSPAVKIIDPRSKEELGRISLGIMRNGDFETKSGAKLDWTHPSWSSSDRVWLNSGGERLLTFALDDSEKAETSVTLRIEERSAEISEKWLLILLGWALIVREKTEQGTKKLANGNPQEFSDKEMFAKAISLELAVEEAKAETTETPLKSVSNKDKPEKLDTETLGETVVDGVIEYGFDFLGDIFK